MWRVRRVSPRPSRWVPTRARQLFRGFTQDMFGRFSQPILGIVLSADDRFAVGRADDGW